MSEKRELFKTIGVLRYENDQLWRALEIQRKKILKLKQEETKYRVIAMSRGNKIYELRQKLKKEKSND